MPLLANLQWRNFRSEQMLSAPSQVTGHTSHNMEAIGDGARIDGVLRVAGHGPVVDHTHNAASVHHRQQRLERMEAEGDAGCRLGLDAQHLLRDSVRDRLKPCNVLLFENAWSNVNYHT